MFGHTKGLNPEQKDAVMHTRGPLLVLAGAGSGKTRVITCRIAQLIAEGVPPENVLAVTFTNKAAREMKERVAGIVGKGRADALFVGTFHRFCLELLREHHAAVGLPKSFTIADSSDQVSNVRRALSELDVGGLKLEPRAAHAQISLFKNKMMGADEALEGASDDAEELVGRAYRRYEQTLRASASVDFDDILLIAERLLRTDAQALAAVRKRCQYVLVDEYQDTNGPQYAVIKHIAGEHRNLCVVGDDDQSIYGWRGADVTRILRFDQDFPGTRVVRLETNYRSTADILQAANRVIANNPTRHDKTLRSALGPGDPVRMRVCEDDVQEAEITVREIASLVARSPANPGEASAERPFVRYGDFAILFRTGTQPRVYETELRARGIPYVLVGGPSFFDRREVRDLLAYLRLAANPKDEASFLRVVNTPPRGIGKTTLERAIQYAARHDLPILKALAAGSEIEGLSAKAVKAVEDFVDLMETLRGRIKATTLVGFIHATIDTIGFKAEVERRYPDPSLARDRWTGVEQIIQAASEHETRSSSPSLAKFLQGLTLAEDDSTDEDPAKRNVVTLMTLHASKGLEYPRVYLVGLEEGILPHARSVKEDGIEEERRLMYVGITRAQRHLTLSLCATRSRGGHRIEAHPSRFVFELQKKEPPETWRAAGTEPPPPAAKKKARRKGRKKAATRRRR